MEIKLFDSELKVMNVLWANGDMPAKEIARVLKEQTGWNVNTTYTLINRCIKKGAVKRSDPGFICSRIVPKRQIQQAEAQRLIDKIFDGSAESLFSALIGSKKLTKEEIDRLKQIVKERE